MYAALDAHVLILLDEQPETAYSTKTIISPEIRAPLVSSRLAFLKINARKWDKSFSHIITEKIFSDNKILHYMQLNSLKKEHSYYRIKFQNPVDLTNLPKVYKCRDKLEMEFRV